jgi:hypothetical protein
VSPPLIVSHGVI